MTSYSSDKIECISSGLGNEKEDYRHMLHIEHKFENNGCSISVGLNSKHQ